MDAGPIVSTSVYVSNDSATVGDTVWLAVKLDLAPRWHVNSAKPRQDYLIPTRLETAFPPAVRAGEFLYPPGHLISLLGDSMSVYESGTTILLPAVVTSDAVPGMIKLTGTLHYQGCDDKSCVAPDDAELAWTITIADRRSVPQHAEIFASVQSGVAATTWAPVNLTQGATPPSDLARLVQEHGRWGYVLAYLFAFGTGLLLSFSPCTYPMIPITVSIFAGQARGAGRGFVLSLFYVLTMAILYGSMGTVVATVGGVFGAWLAHPAVVGTIAAIFVIFALSMFGLYELQVPEGMRTRMAGKGGEGIGGAIVLGAVAALVVSPCVGPFVAGIMLYIATTGSALLGFTILFTFALGLGTFFLLIGTFSSAIQALPRAGEWMESVKKFFGFVLLLMALYFLRTLISTELLALLTGLLLLSAGVFGGGFGHLASDAGFFPRLKKVFGVLCTLIGIYLLAGYLLASGLIWPPVDRASLGGGATSTAGETIPWKTDLDAALNAARQERRPVVIDTWATWCANCHKLDAKTWSDDRVAAEVARFVPVKLQLETNDAPQTRRFLELFSIKQYSLPTIILIDSTGAVKDVIFGFVDADVMLQRLRAVS
ncbi:MAG: thioredoxin family protein [candidate division Zixibacteria bacterium]|nr:thioredoxin family protein [candidate division Zixibacteria bacterium]